MSVWSYGPVRGAQHRDYDSPKGFIWKLVVAIGLRGLSGVAKWWTENIWNAVDKVVLIIRLSLFYWWYLSCYGVITLFRINLCDYCIISMSLSIMLSLIAYVTHLHETSRMSAEFVLRYGPKCMGGVILPILVLLHL